MTNQPTICPKCGHGAYLIKGEVIHECQSSHSRGPWSVGEYAHPDGRPYGLERGIFTVAGQIKIAVCEQWEGEKESQEAEANARLISAAPDLLEALQACIEMYSSVAPMGQSPVIEAARAAIAKAMP